MSEPAIAVREEERPEAAPYGILGLILSTATILLVSAILCLALAAAAFGVSLAALGTDATMSLLKRTGSATTLDPQMMIVASLAIYAVVSLTTVAAARFRAGAAWRDLVGWHAWHPFRRGSALFWTLLVVTLLYSLGADALVTKLHPAAKDWTPHPTGALSDILFFALAALAAPVTEELLFRGWIYTALRASIGIGAGILVSAVLFALAHWESTHLYAAAIFPVGLALGFVRERTGSIAASIAFHALYNGSATLLLFSQQS